MDALMRINFLLIVYQVKIHYTNKNQYFHGELLFYISIQL